MAKARIIYNPTSGREAFRRELPLAMERLETTGYETSAHATTGEGDAMEAARHAAINHFDLVVAAGGDGTINEVVNGLAEQDDRPKLAIIPTGTTNDFARALDIPRDIHKALDVLVYGEFKALDIGRVNEHYFVNIAGGGKLTELTYDAPSKLKTVLGRLAYYVKGIELLPSLRATRCRIEYDGYVFEDDIMLFLVANTNSVGGFEKLAPDARMDDGCFDLLILKKVNLAEFVRLATQALRGNHLDDERMFYTQAKHINVETEEPMQLNIDGEYGGLLPGEFINLSEHIEFLVPANEQAASE